MSNVNLSSDSNIANLQTFGLESEPVRGPLISQWLGAVSQTDNFQIAQNNDSSISPEQSVASFYRQQLADTGLNFNPSQDGATDIHHDSVHIKILDSDTGLTHTYLVTVFKNEQDGTLYIRDQAGNRLDISLDGSNPAEIRSLLVNAVREGSVPLDTLSVEKSHDLVETANGILPRGKSLNTEQQGKDFFFFLMRSDSAQVDGKQIPSRALLFGNPDVLINEAADKAGIGTVTPEALAGFTAIQADIAGRVETSYRDVLEGSGAKLDTDLKADEGGERISGIIPVYNEATGLETTYDVPISRITSGALEGIPVIGGALKSERFYVTDNNGQRIALPPNVNSVFKAQQAVASMLTNGQLLIEPLRVEKVAEPVDTFFGTLVKPTRLDTAADGARYMTYLMNQRDAAEELGTFSKSLALSDVRDLLPQGASQSAIEGARGYANGLRVIGAINGFNTALDLLDGAPQLNRVGIDPQFTRGRADYGLVQAIPDHAKRMNQTIAEIDRLTDSLTLSSTTGGPTRTEGTPELDPGLVGIDRADNRSFTTETVLPSRLPTIEPPADMPREVVEAQLQIAAGLNGEIVNYTSSGQLVVKVELAPDANGEPVSQLVVIQRNADTTRFQIGDDGSGNDSLDILDTLKTQSDEYRQSPEGKAALKELAESGITAILQSGYGEQNGFTESASRFDDIDVMVTQAQKAALGDTEVLGRDISGNVFIFNESEPGSGTGDLIKINPDGTASTITPDKYRYAQQDMMQGRLYEVMDQAVETIDSIVNNDKLTPIQKTELLSAALPGLDGRRINMLLVDSSIGVVVSAPRFLEVYLQETGQIPNFTLAGDHLNAPYGRFNPTELNALVNDLMGLAPALDADVCGIICNTAHIGYNLGLSFDVNEIHLVESASRDIVRTAETHHAQTGSPLTTIILSTNATKESGIYPDTINGMSDDPSKVNVIGVSSTDLATQVNNLDHLPGGNEEAVRSALLDELNSQLKDDNGNLIVANDEGTKLLLCCTHYYAASDHIRWALDQIGLDRVEIKNPIDAQAKVGAEKFWELMFTNQLQGEDREITPSNITSAERSIDPVTGIEQVQQATDAQWVNVPPELAQQLQVVYPGAFGNLTESALRDALSVLNNPPNVNGEGILPLPWADDASLSDKQKVILTTYYATDRANPDTSARLWLAEKLEQQSASGNNTGLSGIAQTVETAYYQTYGDFNRPPEEIAALDPAYDNYVNHQENNLYVKDRTVLPKPQWLDAVEQRRQERAPDTSLVDYANLLEPPLNERPYFRDISAIRDDFAERGISVAGDTDNVLQTEFLRRRNRALVEDFIVDPKYGDPVLDQNGELLDAAGNVLLKWNDAHNWLEVDSNYLLSGANGNGQIDQVLKTVLFRTQTVPYVPEEVRIVLSTTRPDGVENNIQTLIPGVLEQSWELTSREKQFIDKNPAQFLQENSNVLDTDKVETWLAKRRNWANLQALYIVEGNLPVSEFTAKMAYDEIPTVSGAGLRPVGGRGVSARVGEGGNFRSLDKSIDLRNLKDISRFAINFGALGSSANAWRQERVDSTVKTSDVSNRAILIGLGALGTLASGASLILSNRNEVDLQPVTDANNAVADRALELDMTVDELDRVELDPESGIFVYLPPVQEGQTRTFVQLIQESYSLNPSLYEEFNLGLRELETAAQALDTAGFTPGSGVRLDPNAAVPGKPSLEATLFDINQTTVADAISRDIDPQSLDRIKLGADSVLFLPPKVDGETGFVARLDALAEEGDRTIVVGGEELTVPGRGPLIEAYLSKNDITLTDLLEAAEALDAAEDIQPNSGQMIEP